MDGMSVAMIVSSSVARREITSARPDAPVVEEVPRRQRVRAGRPRAALARTLQRAAVVVAPPPAAQP